MTMVSSGPISLGGTATSGGLNQSVNVELGRGGTASINMNESEVRTLAGVPSGAISMNNFYGKANQFAFTISTNQTNANLRTLAVNAGWNQTSKVVATINSGVIVSSNSTGTPGLVINGSFPNGVELINNGTIAGRGGNGGGGGSIVDLGGCCGITYLPGSGGASGGTALSVSVPVSINNGSGTVAGGGGGGGGGGTTGLFSPQRNWSGGGGGGGRTGATNSTGGAGGTIAPALLGSKFPGGAGGNGTSSAAGGGGSSGEVPGGPGGGWGSSGSPGTGGNRTGAGSGAAAGAAVTGNSNITWIATGTRLGGIS